MTSRSLATSSIPPPHEAIRRSRGGCVDCRRAKVKCDESRPSCGTCARRRRVCQGYASPEDNGPLPVPKSRKASKARNQRKSSISTSSPDKSESPDSAGLVVVRPNDDLKYPLIPPGVVRAADEPFVEIYFNRHPVECIIGPEFVNEMNANVILVLQHRAQSMTDCLSGIGHMYLTDDRASSILPVLDRRGRIFASLRALETSTYNLEEICALLLGLCAMELVDSTTTSWNVTIPAVIANSASLIYHHLASGREISSLAKYFIRGIARQDMMVSLTQLRRPMIPTSYWIDDEIRHRPDRLMGYTASFMPLLEELAALAEDLAIQMRSGAYGTEHADEIRLVGDVHDMQSSKLSSQDVDMLERAADLRRRIQLWRPTVSTAVPFRSSRKFLSHASAYRSAALLYLHRLFSPAGVSAEADEEALGKAHDILLYTGGPREETKLLLWPVFIAGCEMADEQDREMVLDVFESISIHRKTVTAYRARRFCIDRVWKARDDGHDWNWMALAREYPHECIPI